jgi:hypothetical protein
MKATAILTIWAVSFLLAALSIESLNIWFWLSLIVFGCSSTYIAKHEDRLLRDLKD